ncbi:MAG: Mov34/MPN/PAD-1 family protein [Anaerolineales bacterium]|nr:Mov34/MPN/PAD-1 family protein [Anaerolineales bacterium]
MSLKIPNELIERINKHIEAAYPGEGAGFLLGTDGDVNDVLPLDNAREEEARHNAFLTPEDYLKAEMKAMELGVDLIGVFHSHLIVRMCLLNLTANGRSRISLALFRGSIKGKTVSHRSWRLLEDRSKYDEEEIEIQ